MLKLQVSGHSSPEDSEQIQSIAAIPQIINNVHDVDRRPVPER